MEDEPRVGYWKPIYVSNIWESIFSCSVCGKPVGIHMGVGQRLYNYCPFCGIEMMKGEEQNGSPDRDS